MNYRKAATDNSTEGLVSQLLAITSNTNGLLIDIDNLVLGISEAKAAGEPVSSAANAVINILGDIRGNYEAAAGVLLTRMEELLGKATVAPRPEEDLPEGETPEE
jgi:hypothetical protein